MKRLPGFNYKSPYFYMVTLTRRQGLAAFSRISEEEVPQRYLVENAITRAFSETIRDFAGKWWGIFPIDCFVVMPDHLHLLIRLKDTGDQMELGKYVYQLMKALSVAYWETVVADGTATAKRLCSAPRSAAPVPSGACSAVPAPSGTIPPVFNPKWHDWIVKKEGQLAAFQRYIRENPERAWLRRRNARYFQSVRRVAYLGREWFAYGNTALLDLPVHVPVKGHRSTVEGSPEWNALVGTCSRIGPGGAGIGTFMSPLEKACGNTIAKAGGSWIVLSPEGFHERWHPPREKERFCAEGRMLFLSLYAAMERQPTNAELYQRCHEMGDIVVAGLKGEAQVADGTATAKRLCSAACSAVPVPSGTTPLTRKKQP